jgi:heme O synthase-like polyprenyltransferase
MLLYAYRIILKAENYEKQQALNLFYSCIVYLTTLLVTQIIQPGIIGWVSNDEFERILQ